MYVHVTAWESIYRFFKKSMCMCVCVCVWGGGGGGGGEHPATA